MKRCYQLFYLLMILKVEILSAESNALKTEIHYFRPFAHTNAAPSYQIHHIEKGRCLALSKKVNRADAFVCEVNSKSLDPCFSHQTSKGTYMLCFESPFSSLATGILLEQPLPMGQNLTLDFSKMFPWGIKLLSGEQCLAMGVKFNDPNAKAYSCNDGSYLLANIHRCHQPWQILRVKAGQIQSHEIAAVYF